MKKLLFSVLLLLAMAFGAVAQTEEVTIGNGTESYYHLPTNMYYNYSLTQQIFTAEEVGSAGAITSISFFYDYTNYFDLPEIKVYMMNIDKNSFESDADIVDMTGTTLVYEGNVSATGSGWITIELDDEFYYNGNDNLLVCMYDYIYGYPGSSYTYRCTETTDYMSISYYSDYYCPDFDNLTSYSGNKYIYNYRNNIKLTINPNASTTCQRVNSLAASNITSSTADVSWMPGGSETAWVLKYGVHGFDVETEGTTVELTSTNYTINGLADNTPYDVFVKAVCGNDDESGWKKVTFRTKCDAIVSFPWSEDFNTYDSDPFSAPCWENEHLEGYGSDIFWIYPWGNESNNTGLIYLPNMTSGTLTKLVLPGMTIPDEGIYKFSIDVLRNSDSYADEGIRIFASTDGEIEGATELGFVSRDYTQSDGGVVTEEDDYGWYTYAFTIPFSGTCYIILRGESQYGSATCMDNFVVREAYSEAEILTFTLPTQMSEATINSGNGTIAVSVANSTDMDALVPEITISDFAEISDPTITGEGNVRTFACTVTAEAGNTKDWTITVTRAPVSHNAFITGFTFYGQKEGTEATIVSDTENGIYTVNAVAEWDLELSDIAPTVTVSVAATMTPESETSHDFTNPVNYTVTAEDGETTHTYAVTIVNDPDACITPWNIYVSNITTNSASVEWEQTYTETSYRIKVSTEIMRDMTLTADVFEGIVDTTTMDIEGLTPGTLYYVYIQSNCENANDWEYIDFTTACEPISVLPYEDGFENSLDMTPACWIKVGDGYAMITDYNGNTGANSVIFGGTRNGNILALPQFETNGSAIMLDFYTKPESYTNSNCGTFEVGYITDLNDATTFTAIETYSYNDWSNNQYERKVVNMSSVPAGSYFAFNHKANSNIWYWFVDDVVVRYISDEAEIVDFNFPTRMSAPVIDSANATIAVVASYQADFDDLEETVIVSDYATYVENTANIAGTTKTYTYTVTAENGTTTKDWTVTVTKAEAASNANDILSFTFDGQHGESIVDAAEKTVTAYAEWYIDLDDYISPEIIVSPMATITPGSGVAHLFNEPVQYTVTAEDGESVATWTVTITTDPNACVNPFNLNVYNVEETSATLQWEPSFNETSYLVKVSTAEMDDMTATADVYDGEVALAGDEIELDLTELAASTSYYVYVQSNCGTDEWVETFFMTECDGSAHSLPFIETFDATSATRQCWNFIDANHDYYTWYYDYDYIYNEEVARYEYSSYNANDWLISPKLAIVEGANLTFEYWCDRDYPERFSVYVMDNPTNYASATQVLSTQIANSSFISTIPSINLTAYAGQEIYIGIKCESEADQESLFIDNFKIEVITHTITLTVGEHGSVTPCGENGVVTVGDGADAEFTITPDEGYQIEAIYVDGNPIYCDVAGETYTFTSVSTDHTLSVTFVPSVSVDENEAASMSVYPNPNNGMFSIDFSNIEGDATYQLIDARGVVIETRDINVTNGETINFNHNLRAGAYFVRIINGDKVYVGQIIVE
ncbi:MAG: fibronectin type III domain-containing protein [Bacteroidales bacterium]|nr:fibronectin type III domain-containing protein [Bacteroidales bacterium]